MMFLNPGFLILSVITSSCLFGLSIVLFSIRSPFHVDLATQQYDAPWAEGSPATFSEQQLIDMAVYFPSNTSLIPPHSLTAILPILSGSLHRTEELLEPFLQPQEHVLELVIICPDTIASAIRRILQDIFFSLQSEGHPVISLRPWHNLQAPFASLKAAAATTTEWVLIMDDTGLSDQLEFSSNILLHPPNISLPFGPHGQALTESQVGYPTSWGETVPGQYVRPPFVMASSLSPYSTNFDVSKFGRNSWADFGAYVVSLQLAPKVGGILFKESVPTKYSSRSSHPVDLDSLPDQLFVDWDDPLSNDTIIPPDVLSYPAVVNVSEARPLRRFVILLPTNQDIEKMQSFICAMQATRKWRMQMLVYGNPDPTPVQSERTTKILQSPRCAIQYNIVSGKISMLYGASGSAQLLDWLGDQKVPVDVILCLEEGGILASFLCSPHKNSLLHLTTVIRIPRSDLSQTEWMSSLSVEEWQNWHTPRVDITVITNDRPSSLQRLLNSLQAARYFGDTMDLRINIDQSCDAETLTIAEHIRWPFGKVFIHRRIIHAGLLPAIVESWYPQNDDSYGLLLEDDVELSPLFYAWLKMSLLRYRYGSPDNKIPTLFGISLYQQKNLELPPGGRQPFNPRTYLFNQGLEHPTTPYLSQVPCSWGALYFPEHWREFYDYLSIRLSETIMPLEEEVVPKVRSNQWSKSWKRFFIELVFLRGYVMLYPNYEDFVSLSTNHLEVGSHVKERSQEKRDLFDLPLMGLEDSQGPSKLLDMPDHVLPRMNMLPILNLTGSLTSSEEIIQQGHSRKLDLVNCKNPFELYNIRSLMCINTL